MQPIARRIGCNNPLVIIFLVDDVADRPWAGELQDERVHPTDVIRHEKKAAGRQVFQTQRSDPIKAAHQRPSKKIEQTFCGGHFASHRMCHSERSEESLDISAPIPTETNQRCFASLNVTAPFKSWVRSIVYDLQSARGKLQSAIVDAICRDKSVSGARTALFLLWPSIFSITSTGKFSPRSNLIFAPLFSQLTMYTP